MGVVVATVKTPDGDRSVQEISSDLSRAIINQCLNFLSRITIFAYNWTELDTN